jgi:hypothetical protein
MESGDGDGGHWRYTEARYTERCKEPRVTPLIYLHATFAEVVVTVLVIVPSFSC